MMGIDSFWEYQERKTRPKKTAQRQKAESLEQTQPITVKESELSDTAVHRVRKAMVEKTRGK